ncbi:MAG: Holliday junction branch migration protein RuvA [Rhizobiaceae bacterium]|nr:Holliday junction branch migration protein RuvA [Rhizobiaceae bacterium]
MIGKLKGTVDEIAEDHVIVDVHGVGYVAYCGAKTLGALPAAGEAVTLFIETYVREDMLRLYGFSSELERGWFRLLQNVQGVGSKVALAVLGTLSTGELATAIALQDRAMISRAPGVGPKVAARILVELKDKSPAFTGNLDAPAMELKRSLGDGVAPAPVADAVSALVNLGYSREQAANAVSTALRGAGEAPSSAVLIRLGLRELARA